MFVDMKDPLTLLFFPIGLPFQISNCDYEEHVHEKTIPNDRNKMPFFKDYKMTIKRELRTSKYNFSPLKVSQSCFFYHFLVFLHKKNSSPDTINQQR